MPRSQTEIYLHCVWATQKRQPFLMPSLEARVYHCIQSQAQELGCTVLAIGGMPDHVHLVVQMPAPLGATQLIKQIKGASSRLANQTCGLTEALYWQEGYGAFSLSRSHLERVISYVKNQKQRHAQDTLWDDWERCGS